MSSTSVQKGGDVERVEHVRAKSGGGFKRHCARRWWIYLIVTLAVILAVVLGLIFGVLPAIAQKTINESTLTVHSIDIGNPTPDSFIYGQKSTVHGHVPTKAHLNPQTISMFLEGPKGEPIYPFMSLNVGKLDLKDEFAMDVADYDMKITNMTSFEAFTKLTLSAKEFRLALRSRPEIVTGSLKNFVDYNKVVTLKGFNGLAGAKIYESSILDKAEADGTNMRAKLFINNTSTFELACGDLTANFAVGSMGMLGYGVVKDLVIKRGENHVTINGHLADTFVQDKTMKTLLGGVMKSGGVNITVTGNSTVNAGEHITWLESALNHLPLEVPMLGENEKP